MIEKLDRGRVVKTWIGSGIQDFLIAFQIDEEFPFFVAFLYHQGLEKISKGYLLGQRSVEYESLPFQQAKGKINKIAIDKKKMGHNLKEMIQQLVELKVLEEDVFKKRYLISNDTKFNTGAECIEILQKAYLECRYPVPDPSYKKYPIAGSNGHWYPIGSSEPRDFAYGTGLKIIKKAEQDFNLTISKNKSTYCETLKNEDWLRFRRIFFEDILCKN